MIGGGLPRTPNLADRRATPRSAQLQRGPEEAQLPVPDSRSMQQQPVMPSGGTPTNQRPSRWKNVVFTVITLLLLGVIGALVWFGFRSNIDSTINHDRYQAVFLSSGQVYFGNLELMDSNYMRLTNVFYIQSDTATEDSEGVDSVNDSNFKLIPMGDEVHGPESEMIIVRDQVLFFENLKPNSKVSELIGQLSP